MSIDEGKREGKEEEVERRGEGWTWATLVCAQRGASTNPSDRPSFLYSVITLVHGHIS